MTTTRHTVHKSQYFYQNILQLLSLYDTLCLRNNRIGYLCCNYSVKVIIIKWFNWFKKNSDVYNYIPKRYIK